MLISVILQKLPDLWQVKGCHLLRALWAGKNVAVPLLLPDKFPETFRKGFHALLLTVGFIKLFLHCIAALKPIPMNPRPITASAVAPSASLVKYP